MTHILKGNFSPFQGFVLPIFIFCHFSVGGLIIRTYNMRTNYFLYKSTDFAWSNDFMKPQIYFFIYCYG